LEAVTHRKIAGSTKNSHQTIEIDGCRVGELWREQAHVTVSKMTAPRRTALKWRWFSKIDGQHKIFGRGDRVAMILGPGFSTKTLAVGALTKALADASATPDVGAAAAGE
jgi:hypothetical protein